MQWVLGVSHRQFSPSRLHQTGSPYPNYTVNTVNFENKTLRPVHTIEMYKNRKTWENTLLLPHYFRWLNNKTRIIFIKQISKFAHCTSMVTEMSGENVEIYVKWLCLFQQYIYPLHSLSSFFILKSNVFCDDLLFILCTH